MRKSIVTLLALLLSLSGIAQSQAPKKKVNLATRPGDHLMIQLSYDTWMGEADSVSPYIGGLPRGANVYLMLDRPFKGNPKISAAFGLGVGTSHMFFKRMVVDIASQTPYLPFLRLDTLNHFKKFKVATAYLELPVEIRYTARPELPNKSFKFAAGLKIGTLLSAATKGKNFQDKDGNILNESIQKTKNRSYFNSTRLAATARIGYGYFTLFGAYNITTLFKDNVAPDTRLLQVGITFSGL